MRNSTNASDSPCRHFSGFPEYFLSCIPRSDLSLTNHPYRGLRHLLHSRLVLAHSLALKKCLQRIIVVFLDPISAGLPLACTQSARNQGLLSLMNSVRFGEGLCSSYLTCLAAGAFLFVIAIWSRVDSSFWWPAICRKNIRKAQL